ncbi:MAG: hypothetical protein AVDCRST_MAG39-2202 [uncultured Sphingomonadaceae bacterium]|uniref:Uncharacterized protein n=1 Tax=uncultured Sphingomonadaceae bacterium TaxID=169976 RepID=A0A6J4T6E3_9SPHN|nr:MAG: hypothetical protein AVDCRST_MAG39-2202 [uncultured Sphingomonadaceae bacterium]
MISGCIAAWAAGAAAGAGALGPADVDASSPSPARSAITVPTFTPSEPSGINSFATVPSSTASNSIVALSVSTSARRSPATTLSPSFTAQRDKVPSSMVGDSAGILISIGMGRSLWGADGRVFRPGPGHGQGRGLREGAASSSRAGCAPISSWWRMARPRAAPCASPRAAPRARGAGWSSSP